jgi:hypothetical protein
MTQPFVGLPTSGDGCAYAPYLDRPECGEQPTVHLIAVADGWGMVTLSSCAAHARVARLSASVITEHTWHDACVTNDCVAVPDA